MTSKSLPKGTKLSSPADTYTILDVIGSGGFGITYKAFIKRKVNNIMTKPPVAIKEHFPASDCERASGTSSISYSSTARQRVMASLKEFINEANCLRRIAGLHPNIVNVNEVFEANNTAYYVMEYLEGKTLKQYVKEKGALSVSETLSIMMPVIEAVATLHRNKFTHLDLKPSNIMMEMDEFGDLRPVIIDFGLAKHYNPDGSATATTAASGFSEGYAPVEQYSSVTVFSPQIDVYALSATILFCLTGKTPPRSIELSSPSVLMQVMPKSISHKLKRLLLMGMSYSSADRLPNAHQLLLSLEPFAKEAKATYKLAGVTLYGEGAIHIDTPEEGDPTPDKTGEIVLPDDVIIESGDNSSWPHRWWLALRKITCRFGNGRSDMKMKN